jgi:hypothetical protein
MKRKSFSVQFLGRRDFAFRRSQSSVLNAWAEAKVAGDLELPELGSRMLTQV